MTRTMAPETTSATMGPPPQMVLEAVEESVADARAFARQFVDFTLTDMGDEQLDDFLLVVSELVTNAVRYGTEPGTACASSWTPPPASPALKCTTPGVAARTSSRFRRNANGAAASSSWTPSPNGVSTTGRSEKSSGRR